MATERLYPLDSLYLRFRAKTVAQTQWQGKTAVVLDRTAFYPESGGQLGDRGVVSWGETERAVLDTQVDEQGLIHHLLEGEGPGPDEGQSVVGQIDEQLRRQNMSKHTGQHILSQALWELFQAETVSSRLGHQVSTIDVSLASLDEAQLVQAEELANRVVLEDRPVNVLYPSPEQLQSMPLRRKPKVQENVRVIEVQGFDLSPCGGTHCVRTGQVGPIHIAGWERYKGLCRITFLTGAQALTDYRNKDAILRELGRSLSCAPSDIRAGLGKLRDEVKAANERVSKLRAELAETQAKALWQQHPERAESLSRIVVAAEALDIEQARALSQALAQRADVLALVACRSSSEQDWHVVITRGAQVSLSAGQWMRELAQQYGGRGGGSPERAEGRLKASLDFAVLQAHEEDEWESGLIPPSSQLGRSSEQ